MWVPPGTPRGAPDGWAGGPRRRDSHYRGFPDLMPPSLRAFGRTPREDLRVSTMIFCYKKAAGGEFPVHFPVIRES